MSIPKRLSAYDVTIYLAGVKNFSSKMKNTGKVSRTALKKWRVRDLKECESNCCKGICAWLPSTTIDPPRYRRLNSEFNWTCRRCRCSTAWVWTFELSEIMLNAYREHTKEFDDSVEEFPDDGGDTISGSESISDVCGYKEDGCS